LIDKTMHEKGYNEKKWRQFYLCQKFV